VVDPVHHSQQKTASRFSYEYYNNGNGNIFQANRNDEDELEMNDTWSKMLDFLGEYVQLEQLLYDSMEDDYDC
jgi:hypothetical protein